MKTKIILIIVAIICIILYTSYDNPAVEYFTGIEYEVPSYDTFAQLLVAPDSRYVFDSNTQVFLLPFQYLNFNNPRHRHMYFYNPGFYFNHYPTFWPWSINHNTHFRGRNWGRTTNRSRSRNRSRSPNRSIITNRSISSNRSRSRNRSRSNPRPISGSGRNSGRRGSRRR